MSLKRTKGRESRKPRTVGTGRGSTGTGKVVLASRHGAKVARAAGPRIAAAKSTAPKIAVKTTLKSPAPAVKVAVVKADAKPTGRPALKIKDAAKLALTEVKAPVKPERIHSHPTMCLHCHLIVEMFHERGADPVKGAWQCPRCGHKYLFSHWKIKRQARGKPEAA
jgi:DNA-directed RNA polymerase subunit RPC12/RpoP